MIPVTQIAKAGTVVRKEDPWDKKKFLYTFFENTKGQKVLVCHGSPDGVWPVASREAIEQYIPDIIYCCYPRMMKINNKDFRVQGDHMMITHAMTYTPSEDTVVIHIRMSDSKFT